MAIPLWPDWNRLYDQGKCLERWVPFTDEQQAELFKVRWDDAKKWQLIRKWRAEFEVQKLQDPTQIQAKENAKAISEAMKNVVTPKAPEKVETPEASKKWPSTDPDATEPQNSGNEVKIEDMDYQSLLAQAQEMWLELKSKKKADVIEAIKEALNKEDGE